MNIIESQGDLFDLNSEWVFAHCISSDVTKYRAMGAGIAKTFRQKYPDMPGEISKSLKVGKAVRYQEGDQVIYNLVTKKNVYNRVGRGMTLKEYNYNLRVALGDLRRQMIKNKEKKLAMPKIGSGLDGGSWFLIRRIIEDVFKETSIEIIIKFL